MSYRLNIEESVEAGCKRIAHEQLDKTLDELKNDELDRHKTVHQVRKRCKKLRGLLRLIRLSLDDSVYKSENAWYRDAARSLSYVRDAHSLVETNEDLLKHFKDQLQTESFRSIKKQLVDRRVRVTDEEVGLAEELENFSQKMVEAKKRVDSWKIEGKGFDAMNSGLEKSYARARDAMEAAYKEPSAENFHEWRKRTKYHWYHLRLLRRIWSPVMRVRLNAAKELSDFLGDDHDLAVLRETITKEPDDYGSKRDIQAFVALLDRRREQLQIWAKPLGQRLFCETSKEHSQRLRSYWNAWQLESSQISF